MKIRKPGKEAHHRFNRKPWICPVVHVSDCEAIGGGIVPTILKSRCPSLMDIACNGRRGWKIPLTGSTSNLTTEHPKEGHKKC